MEQFFATCPRGLEMVLAEELRAFNAQRVHAVGGGVLFSGDFFLCYRVNLESRIASRILWRITGGPYRHEQDIYRIAFAPRWTDWFEPTRTIRVDVSAIKSPLTSLNFITLKIKDAVCDKVRLLSKRRPNVDTHAPDIPIQAHLTDREFTVYLDTTGEPLFKRGLRKRAGEAPLRENLAAGILRLAGWHPGIPLLDPMCGSGTILVEAALIALNITPGLGRQFAFEKLANFDAQRWRELRRNTAARQKPKKLQAIYGSDIDSAAVKAARANIAAAGVAECVTLQCGNVLDITPPASEGIILSNPPYGVRLGEQQVLAEFYPRLGDLFKKRFTGWRVFLLSADMRLPKLIHLAVSRRVPIFNGALECRLFEYRMVAGRMTRENA
jgi:putative N6-adenine-specific DNA methylase